MNCLQILYLKICSRLLGKFSLQTILIVTSVLQIVGMVGLTGYLSFHNSRQAVNNLTNHYLGEVSERVTQKLESYLTTADLINRLNVSMVKQDEIIPRDLKRLHRHLILQYQQFPQVTSILFANPKGDLRSIHGVNPLDSSLSSNIGNPLEAGVSDVSNPSKLRLYSADSNGNLTRYLETLKLVDVRKRPWYREAVKRGKAGWSDVFLIGTTNTATINAYRPVYDKASSQLLGVFSVNVSLLEISK
ncbi:MAG: hypothetical protein HC908_17870, partial [Calothrix sp. SM1_7_51]|nr:hypothetical protein [Calothrix sp. SM1_7_51]